MVMLIIAVVVAVTIGITRAKLNNVVSYTYYNAYSTLRSISTEMLADWNPKDSEYKQAYNFDLKNNRFLDRKSTRLNSSHASKYRMPSSA